MRALKRIGFLLATVLLSGGVSAQAPQPGPTRAPASGPTPIFTAYEGKSLRKGESRFSVAYGPTEVRTEKLASKLMAREISYRIILPPGYSDSSNSSKRFPVIYLLHGLFGHFDNWTDKTKLAEYAARHSFVIVNPEGGDGWYTDSVSDPNDKYESYIIKELIPEIAKRYRTIEDRQHRVVAGLSMGGYGAIKFGLKYQDLFGLVGSFSGALDAPVRGQEHKNYRPSIMAVFGSETSPIRRENDVFSIIKGMSSDRLKRMPYVYISCGTEDSVNFQLNYDFAGLLVEKKIGHEYRHFPGAHAWAVWDVQVKEFLELAEKQIGTGRDA